MTQDLPLITTHIAFCRQTLLEFFKPGELVDGELLSRLARELEMIADMAGYIDREISVHRRLMDETHARKVAAALGTPPTTETMQ